MGGREHNTWTGSQPHITHKNLVYANCGLAKGKILKLLEDKVESSWYWFRKNALKINNIKRKEKTGKLYYTDMKSLSQDIIMKIKR